MANRERGLHTLCLLDIKVKEPTLESLTRKRKEYEPPWYMTAADAAKELLKVIEIKKKSTDSNEKFAYDGETLCVGLARVGWDDQQIVACSLKKMTETDLGSPLHSLVIPGNLHPIEEEMLKLWAN